MLHKMSSVLLSSLVLVSVFSSLAMTQDQKQVEVDPLLVDDLKGERTSSLKLVEVEFRIVLLDTNRIRDDDMDSIRGLFGVAKANRPAAAVGFSTARQPETVFRPLFAGGMLGNVSAKLRAGSAEGPIKHQVLETEPFQALLTWMSAQNVAAYITNTSSRRIALGSTAVVLDQRVSLPRLAKKNDARTGIEIHTINFVHSGLHLELTPLAQTFPKTKEQAEVWQLRLDRVVATLTAGEEPESKLDRVQHTVTLGVGQTALIPQLVESNQPAFILLSVKAPKPSTGMGMMSSTMGPAVEIIRLSKKPDGPGLVDRITQTLVPPQGTPKPSLFKQDDTVSARTPAARLVEAVTASTSARNLGVVQRVVKESEIPRREGVSVLELQENEIVEVVLSDKVSNVRLGGDQKSLLMARPLEPTSLAIQAGRKGVGTVEFEAGKDAAGRTARFHFEVIVRGDTRLLGRTLDTLFPDDKVELTEVNGAIVIRGAVSRSAVAKQIVEIAEQFYPQVLNQTESRDSNQLLPAGGADTPKVAPAIGTKIRDLRTDVRSLRDEIQKLIKVLEKKSDLKDEATLPEATRVRLGDDPLPRVKFRQPGPRR